VGQTAVFSKQGSPSPEGWGDCVATDLRMLCSVAGCVQDGVVITAEAAGGNRLSLLYANAAFTNLRDSMTGVAREENAASLLSCHASRGADPLWASLMECHQSDDVYLTDVTHDCEDGFQRLLHLRSEPIRDESGRITHRVSIFRDGTEQANLKEALRQNERLACIGLLAAGIAHEINNPTGSALLAAETALAIKDSDNADEQLISCLQNIITSMDRCGRIVRTLLRYSREESTEKQACSINDVAKQALDLARPYGESHGAVLRLELDDNLPLIPMNPLEIELVLVNLIRNAVEAGEGKVVVSIHTVQIEGGVRIEVRDDGHGMNAEQLSRVFDPLYTTRRLVGGSGLGMNIAYGIVQEHKGHMRVRSKQGRGTTVIIDLPITVDTMGANGK